MIERLVLDVIIGVHERERKNRQPVLVHLWMDRAGSMRGDDDIDATIDYEAVIDLIHEKTFETHFRLVETLADFIADLVLGAFGVESITVEARKTGVVPKVGSVGVRISRSSKSI